MPALAVVVILMNQVAWLSDTALQVAGWMKVLAIGLLALLS
jgi:hypothetical protein